MTDYEKKFQDARKTIGEIDIEGFYALASTTRRKNQIADL